MARVDGDGDAVLLEDQNRSLWNQDEIREGLALLDSALRGGAGRCLRSTGRDRRSSRAVVARQDTDWKQIAALYQALWAFSHRLWSS